MAEMSEANGNNGISLSINEDDLDSKNHESSSGSYFTVPFMQKVIAELLATYFLIFAGCAALVVNAEKDKVITVPGIAIVWGLVVMALVYTVGHISGAHFNPAVTIAFATCKRFPWKQVPAYVAAHVLAAILASGTLRLLFNVKHGNSFATIPTGSNAQSLVLEFIITFLLMFVISAVVTDNRAIGDFAGVAIGSTVSLNGMFAGPISGGSMNPARSLGSAIVLGHYKGIWIYILGPIAGAVAGAGAYDIIRFTDKPLTEITGCTFSREP